MNRTSIRVIAQSDIAKIFHKGIDQAIALVEKAIRKDIVGTVQCPDKISQIFDDTTQDRINCMPAALLDEKVCGVKWISVFPSNNKRSVPNVSGSLLLSETESGSPIALMDASLLTSIRTAAVGSLAAQHLAPSNVETISIIGTGKEARMHYIFLTHLFPSIKTCRVYSRSVKSMVSFQKEMSTVTPNVEISLCDNSLECSKDSDIIVTAISSQAPVLKADGITKGGLYIHVGGWEDEYGVALKADKIVCDDWKSCKHRSQTICRMYKEGILSDSNIYANLSDLVSGKKTGRENDNEFIYFNSVGLAYIDMTFAKYIYDSAVENNLGVMVNLSENDDIDYSSLI